MNVEQSQFPPDAPLSYQELGALSDDRVMENLAAGNGDAITVLFDRYGRLVLRIGLKILHDQGEAEDMTQEVFLDLCRTAEQFDATKGSTKMWIIRAASRRALNRRRHLKFRQFYSQTEMDESLLIPADAASSVLPSMSPPDARRLVLQMLDIVGSAQREVLEMVFFEGLTLQEVAARTGDTLGSVRHRYYRGLERMRRALQQKADENNLSGFQGAANVSA